MMSRGASQRMHINRTVAEIAALVSGRVEGSGERRLARLLAPDRAGPDDLAAVFRSDTDTRADVSLNGVTTSGDVFPSGVTVQRSDPVTGCRSM